MIAPEIPLSDVLAFRIPRTQLVTCACANGYEGVRNPIRFGNLAPWRIRFAGRPRHTVVSIPGSSNGRTALFGGAYRGSNPRPGASLKQ